MRNTKEKENIPDGEKNSEYFGMTIDEKSEYLEGKLDILKRNSADKERRWARECEEIKKERIEMGSRIEEMKKEIKRLKEELREEKAETKMIKRIKSESALVTGYTQSTQCSTAIPTQMTMDNSFSIKNLNGNTAMKQTILSKPKEVHTLSTGDAAQTALPIEWILSHLKGEILFSLTDLSSSKLKIFGRFFKREFDSLYNRKEVLAGIEGSQSTKHLIKCLLYLSDRPEIISSCMPYVFMKHIVPDGKLYIKDIVRILYKVGVAPFLQSANTIDDIKRFFNECRESEELLSLVEALAQKSPRGIARLISEEYLVYACSTHPERARRLIGLLEGCGVNSASSEAIIALYTSSDISQYDSKNKEYTFFL
ncbi:hypothetical protein NEAUS03_1719 [Nematocida ausubeli]|nr:hypothetical protein NEAUS03_1719 [Nematocida ausubeli]